MALFKSREAEAVATIEAKLTAAEAEVEAADQRLRQAALDAALSPDPWAAEPHHEALRRARERVQLLRHALAEANRLENERKASLLAKERAQQNRAIAQHIGSAKRAAQRFQTAITNADSAFRELLEIGGQIEVLLPPHLVDPFRHIMSPHYTGEACHIEIGRQGRDNPNEVGARQPFPGSVRAGSSSWYPSKVTPLAEDLAGKLKAFHAMLVGHTEAPEPNPAAAEQGEPIHPAILAADPFLTRAEPEAA